MFNPPTNQQQQQQQQQQQRIVSRSPLRTQAHTNPNLAINPSPQIMQTHPFQSPFGNHPIGFDSHSPLHHHQRSLTDNKLSPLNIINCNPLTASYFQQQVKPKDYQYQYSSNKPQTSSPQTSQLQKQLKQIPLQHDGLPLDSKQNEINRLKSELNFTQQDLNRKVQEQDLIIKSKSSEIQHLTNMIQQLQDQQSTSDSKIQSIYSHRKAEEMLLNENEELRQVVVDYQETIKRMREDTSTLQNLKSQIQEYQKINSMYDSLKEDNESLTQLYKEKQWELDAVSNKFRSLSDEYHRLLDIKNQLERELDNQEQQFRQEMQNIKNEQQNQGKFEDLIRGHILQIEDANQQLQMKIEQSHRLESELHATRQEMQECRQALQQSQDRQKLLQQKVIELHEGIDGKNTQIDDMVIKYGELDERFQKQRNGYEKQINVLKQDIAELNQFQMQRELLINQLIKELEEQHNKDIGYHQQVSGLGEASKDYRSYYVNEISRMKKDLVEKNEEIENLKSLIENKK